MKEHGLLLTAPMALARHERRKTQTRRLVSPYNSTIDGKRPGKRGLPDLYRSDNTVRVLDDGKQASWLSVIDPFENEAVFVKPAIQPGERIWWRETWCWSGERKELLPGDPVFRSEGAACIDGWRSSLHMPRWAARHVDTVVRVRPERIQDISEEDALAEGIIRYEPTAEDDAEYSHTQGGFVYASAVEAYRSLFININGPEAWERNDWVWVYEWKLD